MTADKRKVIKTTAKCGFARPPKHLRDQARRDLVLKAAQGCVVQHGFHAATMGKIAAAARMSVGQIYRHFENKEAIVHAIVERIVARRLREVIESGGQSERSAVMAEHLAAGLPKFPSDDILMLEVIAESTRNPAVAAIVRRADQQLRAQAVATFRNNHPYLKPREALARMQFLAVLFEGTLLRRLSGRRNERNEEGDLREMYSAVLENVLSKAK